MDENIKQTFLQNIKKGLTTGTYNGITIGESYEDFSKKNVFPFKPVITNNEFCTVYDYNGLRLEVNKGKILNIVIKNDLPIYAQDIIQSLGEGGSSSSETNSFMYYMSENCIATLIFPNFLSPVSEVMISGSLEV